MSAGLLYCMEFLEQNMDWLREKMDPLIEGNRLLEDVFDMMLWTIELWERILADA